MKSETIFVQQHPKHGYEVRTEMVSHPDDSNHVKLFNAYTSSGAYIGDRQTAKFLCEKKGIKPELIDADHNVCSIGFCDAEQKWYGWSRRSIFGFGIGSSVKKGDCGYVPDNVRELTKNETVQVAVEKYDPIGENVDGPHTLSDESEIEWHTIKTGRGEWTARTLDDARQMAIDFANGVA